MSRNGAATVVSALAVIFVSVCCWLPLAAELEHAVGGELFTLSSDGAQLRERFNADRGYTRLLMLLSPS